jgi:hypothetical protein
MLQGAGQLSGPVVSGPVGGSTAPETIATPQPTPGSAYQEALNNSGWGDGYGSGGGCNDCGLPSCCGCCNNWYAYVGGLVMGRDMPNRFWTTFEAGNPPNQLQYFPGADWGGGVDTRIGYWFGCGCGDPCNGGCGGGGGRVGIEAVYWGAWDLNGENQIYDPNNALSAVTDVGLVSFGGAPVPTFFDNARSHRLTRENEFHNVELNFLYLPCCNPCQRFQVTAVAGVRDEAATQCYALQTNVDTAMRLGASREDAGAIAAYIVREVQPALPADYRTRDCFDDGPLDLRPELASWP